MNLEKSKIENLFNKFDINELYELKVILNNDHEIYKDEYKNIFYKVLKEKKRKSNYFLLNKVPKEKKKKSNYFLLNKVDKLNNEELNLLYELVEDAALYLSSIQDYSYAYEYEMEDFNITEYPLTMIYELEEKLSEKIKERNKQLVYKP